MYYYYDTQRNGAQAMVSKTISISVNIDQDVDVDINLDHYKDQIEAALGKESLETWYELQLQYQRFGVDELKKHIEDQFFTRFGMRIEL